jgi:hypothetical protein
MALIVVRDAKQKRERILNTDHIYECREEEGLVRIRWAVDAQLRDNAYVEGTVAEFAKLVGAVRVG